MAETGSIWLSGIVESANLEINYNTYVWTIWPRFFNPLKQVPGFDWLYAARKLISAHSRNLSGHFVNVLDEAEGLKELKGAGLVAIKRIIE